MKISNAELERKKLRVNYLLVWVNLALALAAVFYTWETRSMRQSIQQQSAILAQEARISQATILTPLLRVFDQSRAREPGTPPWTEAERSGSGYFAPGGNTFDDYAGEIRNLSANIAQDVTWILHNEAKKDLVYIAQVWEFILPNSVVRFSCKNGKVLGEQDLRGKIRERYEGIDESYLAQIQAGGYNWIAVIYRDVANRVCMVKRQFTFKKDRDGLEGELTFKPMQRFGFYLGEDEGGS